MTDTTLSPKSDASPASRSNAPATQVALSTFSAAQKVQLSIILAASAGVGLLTASALTPSMAAACALVVFCIGMWATAVVPLHWTSLLFFLIVVVFQIAPAQTVFSGFGSSTFWLLFASLVLNASIRFTGLDQRAAVLIARLMGSSYRGVLGGVIVFALALSFVIPSAIGRIVIMVPIIITLAGRMGYGEGSNGRTGMVLAASFATFMPALTILPANVPNLILSSMAETLYGHQISYADYLLLHFPILGALKAVLMLFVIAWLFPDQDPTHSAKTDGPAAPLSGHERHLLAVLALCLGLWLTDSIHHISPGWVAMGAAIYCLLPQTNLAAKDCFEKLNYASLFFVVGFIGLGSVISETGLGEVFVHSISAYASFDQSAPLWNVGVLTGISSLVALVTNLPGVPAVMTPMAQDLAALTGLPLSTVLMTQVLAFSNVFLPYQAPPLVAAMQIGNLTIGAVTKVCLTLFFIGAFVLWPLDLLWWHLLGLV
ncbi:SLC13 family permease [Pseudovibrio sp. SPO723]|uniref:SLC13 family permease n=1 Tax=Nesiotobacter zosterae TaxID=392721 RepID=UPI0029C5B8EF|nr:SLC13 family permease [Pseudovibrio sp. SPO723]MDX5593259.1 SLC13 family permease [Pseudovibrio sp. SPO723]